jgi:hypothetical protein
VSLNTATERLRWLTDSVDTLALRRQCVVEDVVARTGNGQNMVAFVDAELLDVHIWILPRLAKSAEVPLPRDPTHPAVNMRAELLVYLFLQIRHTPSLVVSSYLHDGFFVAGKLTFLS